MDQLWFISGALIMGGLTLGFVISLRDSKMREIQRAVGTVMIIAGLILPMFPPKPSVVWTPYEAALLEDAQTAGKPVIIDIFAEWCIPCHELDRWTYTSPEVIEALEPFVRLKADVTQMDSPLAAEIQDRFSVIGVPTIIFIDSKGMEVNEARISGFIGPEGLLQVIRSPRLQNKS